MPIQSLEEARAQYLPVGIYVHIPYCIKKCPYCDFNSYGIRNALAVELGASVSADSHASREVTIPFEENAYCDALLAELEHYMRQGLWQGRPLASVFFGGGTPSLFSPRAIERILTAIFSSLQAGQDTEVTLETNPGTVQEELGQAKLLGFRQAGINRISLGCQSFNDNKLKALGRLHSSEDIVKAVANLTSAGFENFNLDLMFGIGNESLNEWQNDLETAIALQPEHISAYGLTIEPGTEFGRLEKRGLLVLPDEELSADMYTLSQSLLQRHGYLQYEISNYAKTGRECRHNLGYWNGMEYLGLGAGAHSYSRTATSAGERSEHGFGMRWSNIPKPSHYIERALGGGGTVQRRDPIDREKAELEFFYLGLRKRSGILRSGYRDRFGSPLSPEHEEMLIRLRDDGLLVLEEESIRLTEKGFLYSDYVFGALASGSDAF